jgi:hypothetical protein
MCLLNSTELSKLSSATTGVSLITLPPASSSCRMTHSSRCRVLTRPPQNGKAECIIHSVNNIIRTLLIHASLSERYWAEGLHTATYMLNCLPTIAIQDVCPHLALFGPVPSYEHLRVFSCTCYPNTTATAPHKLSPRSTRCVFLGYSADHKGYRCLDLSINRLVVS